MTDSRTPYYSDIEDERCWELNNEPKWHKRVPWKSGMRKLEVEFPENVIQLLQHNDTPSPAQLFELKEYQHKSTVGYPAIRDEIASIDEQIERLSKRRATLKDAEKPYLKKIFACDVILSPIRSIPNEILRKIFSHSIPPNPSPTKGTPPVSLTRVCALWRQIALTMPELWTEIAVIYGSFVNSKKAIARLTHFTKRSWNLPLNIHLVLPDNNNNLSSVFHNTLRFFTTKWSKIGRVRCLDIYSSQMWQTLPALHNNAPPMENLESLTVRGGDYDRSLDSASSASSEPEDARNTHIGNFLLHAPHLTKLSIGFGALGDSILDEKYASSMWSHLTCLYIRDPLDLERWRVIIRLCLNLRQAFFYIMADVESSVGWPAHPPNEHRTMKILAITYQEPHVSSSIEFLLFRWFSFSALKQLQITFSAVKDGDGYYPYPNPKLSIAGHILRSSCPNLKDLSLFRCWMLEPAALVPFLQLYPSLTKIKLSVQNSTFMALTDLLLCRGQSEASLPNLLSVSVEIRDLGEFTHHSFDKSVADKFLEMVEFRFAGRSSNESEAIQFKSNAKLESVALVVLIPPDFLFLETGGSLISYIREEVKIYKDAGLQVEIRDFEENSLCYDPLDEGLVHWEDGYIA